MTTPVEAKFRLDAKLIELGEKEGKVPLVRGLRFFFNPTPDKLGVMVCAERADCGPDVEEYFDLPLSLVGIKEDEVEQMFLAIPSGARH